MFICTHLAYVSHKVDFPRKHPELWCPGLGKTTEKRQGEDIGENKYFQRIITVTVITITVSSNNGERASSCQV